MTIDPTALAAARMGWRDSCDPSPGHAEPLPRLCIDCRTHLGQWPEDDPRCPSCAAGTRPRAALTSGEREALP